MWIIAKKLNILIVDTSPDYSRLRRWCFFANLFAQPPCIPWNFHPFESLLSFQNSLFLLFFTSLFALRLHSWHWCKGSRGVSKDGRWFHCLVKMGCLAKDFVRLLRPDAVSSFLQKKSQPSTFKHVLNFRHRRSQLLLQKVDIPLDMSEWWPQSDILAWKKALCWSENRRSDS